MEVYGKRREGAYAFCVKDYGVGIPEEELKKVTEAFYMVDKSRSRSKNGAGLGLALCVEILRLHDSELIIESKVGQGTIISFEIPDRQEEEPGQEEESVRKEGEKGGLGVGKGESEGGINEAKKDNGRTERSNNTAAQDEHKNMGQD